MAERIDLTGDDTEEDEPIHTSAAAAAAAASSASAAASTASSSTIASSSTAVSSSASGTSASGKKRDRPGSIEYLSLPGGVLDDAVLNRVAAIVQQNNCVGTDGKGLAAGVASKLPYGCPYASRRPMPPQNKFARLEDRAVPGTIEVRKAPGTVFGAGSRPDVICACLPASELVDGRLLSALCWLASQTDTGFHLL